MTDMEPTPTPTEQPPVAQIPVETALAPEQEAPATGTHWGTGRRKSSVARVRFIPGDGKILINERAYDQYFPQIRDQSDVVAPLVTTNAQKQWDIHVSVHGGGTTGQAGAVRLGISRALARLYPHHEPALRNAGFLTRDAREVERKKYGHRKARRRFQFSKR